MATAPRRARPSPAKARGLLRATLLLAPLSLGLVAASLFVAGDDTKPQLDRDAALCPKADRVGHRAVYLLDLRKPLAAGDQARPGALLHTVSDAMRANDELKVFALAPYAEAPLVSVGRLCKPYDEASLAVVAKDGRTERDCDDLPAQLPAALRRDASRYCALRTGLKQRIDELAARPAPAAVEDAHLMDAIAAVERDLGRSTQRAQRGTLYLFSDMMQHADWYSHVDLGWRGWDFAAFQARRDARGSTAGGEPPLAELDVQAFYVPRRGVTDRPRIRHAHQHFWRRYFAEIKEPTELAERGERRIVFLDQPMTTSYRARPRMQLAGETTAAAPAPERERREVATLPGPPLIGATSVGAHE